MDDVDDYHPYFVVLVAKDESQIKNSEIWLTSCLSEVPCEEVSVIKVAFCVNMILPRITGFLKVSY